MQECKIKKPRVFISHASSDGIFAGAVKREIDTVFANGVDVFCTSSPRAIPPGSDWLESIEEQLKSTDAVIAIVTPVSIEKPWLWFEVGATWNQSRDGNCRIYPLCAAEVPPSSLPEPLSRLQALSIAKTDDMKSLFESLIRQFGFGSLRSLKAAKLKNSLPKYSKVQLAEADKNERSMYSGPYLHYSDSELEEVLVDSYFHPASEQLTFVLDKRDSIFGGKLIHFHEVDAELKLPSGTAARLLVKVGKERCGLRATWATEHLVRLASKAQGQVSF